MALIRIGNEDLSVEVSSLGAEMQSLVTSDGQNWLWDGDAAFWGGRSPVLFPIVGKAPEDHVSIAGTRYPMGQHGFARRNEFELMNSGPDFCRFELRSSPATRAIFPFDFVLALEHRVEGRAVKVTAEITNADDRPMPFGIGFHPAFVWPLPGCEGLDHSVILDDGGEPELQRLSGGLLGTHKLPSPFSNGALTLKHHLFDADAMIFPEGAGAGVTYAAKDKAVHFTWDNLPNFAIWSKAGAPFVCLEPWRGMAAEAGGTDALEERPYTEVLGPGASGRYQFKAELVG
ncbi:MAG: aldose 1-epimerase family protein [Candidatus Devosia phytovorans]|uniref:Aldose 1-epimerase family protein n=1 Tax=Candidatus Devosia phytovorans TaxID=3121372 RepID=A0AAJ6AZN3_9HYPH|nr:aldose 1-epimerase family protein [Devosia sp.]WEK04760.1 MAG: aldose 1-epimerase family protein [Devosia sp.]